jgi:predicted dehydrogenase
LDRNMEKLRVGVVGLGFIGALHARIMHELPNVDLIAVNDLRSDIAQGMAEKYSCKAYSDYKEMMEAEALDAVSITLPDELHAEAAICAAEHGYSVLLEKPVAKTAAEAKSILDAAARCGTRLMVGQVLQFDPRYAQLRDAIKADRLGMIVHMFFKRTNPRTSAERLNGRASIFYYLGVHDIEMMCAYAQSRPVTAYCKTVSIINAKHHSEDSVFATITFENGSLAMIELCWALPDNSALGINTYVEIVGSKAAGYVSIQDQGVSIITPEAVEYPDTLHWPQYNGQVLGDLKEELAHFVAATLSGVPYIVDNQNALTAAKVIDACFASIASGMPVSIEHSKT